MKRNFECESFANLFFRAKKAFMSRLRGMFYFYFGFFHRETKSKLVFGGGARFINSKSIKLSENVHFGLLARLECHGGFPKSSQPKIEIGANSSFGDYCHIGAFNKIKIGKSVLGGSNVTIIDHNHGSTNRDLLGTDVLDPKKKPLVSKGPIIIGDNVWIGDGVIILHGSVIGCNAVIAANVVVSGEVPPNTIFFGRQ